MKWCPIDCLVVILIICSMSVVECTSDNKHEKNNLVKYKKCMEDYGIPKWKVVDSTNNATFYNIYNYQWNKIFETVFPIAIFVPLSVSDVQATVKCGFKANIQLVPNSGGHSYAGLSLGTNHSIIVDFRYMTSIDINEKEESVTVGPGTFVGHLHAKLWKNGGWGTGLGNCMTLGMGGHSIGGGVGYFSPLYGLVIDNILEMKLVDARGNAVTVNSTHNTDLWWAMRGVGPGYIGMVPSVKIKIFKAKDLKLTFTQVRYHLKDFQNVIEKFVKWLDWVKGNEPSMSTVIFIVNDNYNLPKQPIWPGIEVQLLHIQDQKMQPNSSQAFTEAYPMFFTNSIGTVTSRPSYIEFVIATGYTPVVTPIQSNPTSSPTNALDDRLHFFSTMTKEMAISRYFFANSFFVEKHLRSEELKEVQEVVSEIPNNTNGIVITSEQGAIGARRINDTAYVHRNSLFNVRLFFEGIKVDDVDAGKKWAKNFLSSTRFMYSGETYQNYPDIELKDYLSRYYGSNMEELMRIKRKWDPNRCFNSKMSIPTNLAKPYNEHEVNKGHI